jgi:DNA-binding transcriptional regulator YiaG
MEQRKSRRRQWDKEAVIALREHLNLTQKKLAEQLGTRQQTISEWEKGVYHPRGMSATVLNIVAERSGFVYQTKEHPGRLNKIQHSDS